MNEDTKSPNSPLDLLVSWLFILRHPIKYLCWRRDAAEIWAEDPKNDFVSFAWYAKTPLCWWAMIGRNWCKMSFFRAIEHRLHGGRIKLARA